MLAPSTLAYWINRNLIEAQITSKHHVAIGLQTSITAADWASGMEGKMEGDARTCREDLAIHHACSPVQIAQILVAHT